MNTHRNEKIFRLRFGTPFRTPAVVIDQWNSTEAFTQNNIIEIEETDNQIRLELALRNEQIVLGLGEQLGALNKRGRRYRAWCVDEPHHNPDKDALYSSHPVLFISGEPCIGLFIDYPSEMDFDIGFTQHDRIRITIPSGSADIYLWQADSLRESSREYLRLTGSSYVPPRWAFGYHQSRWSYPNDASVRAIVDKFEEHGIPLDTIHVDIDYMDGYRVFTIDEKRFPNVKKLAGDLLEKGVRLVSIIDPGVKIDPDYSVYREGIADKHFCTDDDGHPYRLAVWPGWTHLPNFLSSKTRTWWSSHVKRLTERGFAGVWNDMNEPAMFFTDHSLKRIEDAVVKLEDKDGLQPWDIFNLRWACEDIQNYRENFKTMSQHTDAGELVNHWDVHNLYGYGMTMATSQAFEDDKQRRFIFSRSSYSGMHRISGLWTGDNSSRWEHLILQMRMIQNLNLCGFLFCGADVGGFNDHVSPELLVRWTQLGALTPFFRNHSAAGTRDQEPWQFGETILSAVREAIRIRYALMPYIYSEFLKAANKGIPLIRPLAYQYEQPALSEFEDQYFIGDSLMAAPVHQPNARGRYVYLPEERWLMLRMKRWDDYQTEILPAGHHYVKADLNEMLLFIPENRLLILTEPGNSTDSVSGRYVVLGLVAEETELELWEDDGFQRSIRREDCNISRFHVEPSGRRVEGHSKNREVCFNILEPGRK